MNLDEIKDLMDALAERDIQEFELEKGDEKIRIRRGPAESDDRPPYVIVAPGLSAPQGAGISSSAAPAPAKPIDPSADGGAAEADDGFTQVKSPIVGTFYEASSPDAEAFVSIGDKVSVGQVLCIIEAMKLMNEIEAEVAGTVEKRLVSNGQPVEYGEALFAIRPS
jgi:acetyl-CoA carboxylase biotin carboxyl carrier protein